MKWQDAKRIPLTALLAQAGHEATHTSAGGRQVWYVSPFRSETHPSFNVNIEKNLWNDLGLGAGGTVIDFVMRYYALSEVSEVLRKLDDLGFGDKPASLFEAARPVAPLSPPVIRHAETAPSGITLKKVQPLRNTALIHYLQGRGIAADLARPFVQEAYYTVAGRDRTYFALAFPNQCGGYELRNAYFQGVAGSKDISLILPETQDGVEVLVFEGFMDFLSARTLWNIPDKAALILNSVALKDKAIAGIAHHGFTHVRLYLDRDDSGRALTETFQALDGRTVVDASGVYAGFKDFNAYLQHHGARQNARQMI